MTGQATIKSSTLEKNAGEGPEVYVCLSEISKGDTQSIENEHHTGSQSRPPKESRGFWSMFNPSWKYFVSIFDGVPKQALEYGEKIDYASKAGAIVCSIKYNEDGSIDITGDLRINGVLYTAHSHSQGPDSATDTQQNTGGVV